MTNKVRIAFGPLLADACSQSPRSYGLVRTSE